MISIPQLKKVVQVYRDQLEYTHPFVTSDKFFTNSYSKWACDEILREIDSIKDLPFELTSIEFLDQFVEKMKRYAYQNQKNSMIFVIAQETAEYFIEQCWIKEWKHEGRK